MKCFIMVVFCNDCDFPNSLLPFKRLITQMVSLTLFYYFILANLGMLHFVFMKIGLPWIFLHNKTLLKCFVNYSDKSNVLQ